MSRKFGIPATPSFEATPMVLGFLAALVLLAYAVFDTTTYPRPKKPKAPQVSATWYQDAVNELVATNGEAEKQFKAGNGKEAGELVEKGEKLATKVLSIPRPTLEATQAASDTDDLYGRMLASNKNYGWARLTFQKNLVRWKYWKPADAESERRMELARAAIAECDKHLSQ